MALVATANPFTLIYDELWRMVELNESLLDCIALRNRIKFDKSIGPKDVITTADTPELMLTFDGWTNIAQNSSSTSAVTAIYTWNITSGDYRLNALYSQVSWELLRAMVDWDITLCALQWENSSFVKRANIVTGDSTQEDSELSRGISGWTGIFSIDVECHFLTSDLRLPE